MSHWFEALSAPVPPPSGLRAWASGLPTFEDAWGAAPHLEWLVWLAGARAADDGERREVVAGAAAVARPSGVMARMFRLAPLPRDRARRWAAARPLEEGEAVVADWLSAIVVAAAIVVPVALLLALALPSSGQEGPVLSWNVTAIPGVVLITVGAFVAFRQRRTELTRRAAPLDFAGAFAVILTALEQAKPHPEASAEIFRARMQSVHARTRAR